MLQKFYEIRRGNNKGSGIDIRVEGKSFRFSEFLIYEEMYMFFRIINKAERRHGTWFNTEIFFESLIGSKGEFSLL